MIFFVQTCNWKYAVIPYLAVCKDLMFYATITGSEGGVGERGNCGELHFGSRLLRC